MTKTCQAWERGQAGPGSLGLGRGARVPDTLGSSEAEETKEGSGRRRVASGRTNLEPGVEATERHMG